MDSNFVVTQTASVVDSVGSSLVGSLPLILVIFAALVGLGIAIRYLIHWIGSSSGGVEIPSMSFKGYKRNSTEMMSETDIIMGKMNQR